MKIDQCCPVELNVLASSSKPCFPILMNDYMYKSSFAGSYKVSIQMRNGPEKAI